MSGDSTDDWVTGPDSRIIPGPSDLRYHPSNNWVGWHPGGALDSTHPNLVDDIATEVGLSSSLGFVRQQVWHR